MMKKARFTRRFFLTMLLGSLLLFIQGHGNASQELPASGGFKPLSGINRAWLEKMDSEFTWGRNPFYFPRGGTDAVQKEPADLDGSGLRLSAILYHEEGSIAIINHRIVRRGDQIGGRRVVSILQDRVILQDLSGVFELKLDPFGLK
jgi:hypothetical protein